MPNVTTNLSLPLGTLGDVEFKQSFATALPLIDAAIGEILTASKAAHDFASVADGAAATTTVTVTGAALGDFVEAVSLSVDSQGVLVHGYVSAADTVTIRLQNETGAAVDLAATTIRVRVRKA